MNAHLRTTTLEADRLAIEFAKAAASGNPDRIGLVAMELETALDAVIEAAWGKVPAHITEADIGPAKGFEEGALQS